VAPDLWRGDPAMIRAGLTTDGEIARLLAELKRLADDERVLLAQARKPAVSAVKLDS
jgi:hypothetical protein